MDAEHDSPCFLPSGSTITHGMNLGPWPGVGFLAAWTERDWPSEPMTQLQGTNAEKPYKVVMSTFSNFVSRREKMLRPSGGMIRKRSPRTSGVHGRTQVNADGI